MDRVYHGPPEIGYAGAQETGDGSDEDVSCLHSHGSDPQALPQQRPFGVLLAELESGDDAIVSLDVFTFEVVEETATLRDHEHDAAA